MNTMYVQWDKYFPFMRLKWKKKKKSNVSMYEKDNIKSIPLAWFKTTIS